MAYVRGTGFHAAVVPQRGMITQNDTTFVIRSKQPG
jgi:hypothetical protein